MLGFCRGGLRHRCRTGIMGLASFLVLVWIGSGTGSTWWTSAPLLRPANRSPVRGLYLVGGSAHPGGGLPIVALSAKIVADLVGPA